MVELSHGCFRSRLSVCKSRVESRAQCVTNGAENSTRQKLILSVVSKAESSDKNLTGIFAAEGSNKKPRSVHFDNRDVSVAPSQTKVSFRRDLGSDSIEVLLNSNLTAQVCLSICPVQIIGVQPLDLQSEKDASLCLTTSY